MTVNKVTVAEGAQWAAPAGRGQEGGTNQELLGTLMLETAICYLQIL